MRAHQDVKDILTAKAATGEGAWMDVGDFRHLVLSIDTTENAQMTIKVVGTISDVAPDATASQAQDNAFSYIQIVDLADQSVVNGATGIVLTGTDTHRLFEVNTNGLKWVNVVVTSYTAGKLYARCKPFNDAI